MSSFSLISKVESSFKSLFSDLQFSPEFKEQSADSRLKAVSQFQYYYSLPLLKTACLSLALQFGDVSILTKAMSFKKLSEYVELFEYYYYLETNSVSTAAYQLGSYLQQLATQVSAIEDVSFSV